MSIRPEKCANKISGAQNTTASVVCQRKLTTLDQKPRARGASFSSSALMRISSSPGRSTPRIVLMIMPKPSGQSRMAARKRRAAVLFLSPENGDNITCAVNSTKLITTSRAQMKKPMTPQNTNATPSAIVLATSSIRPTMPSNKSAAPGN